MCITYPAGKMTMRIANASLSILMKRLSQSILLVRAAPAIPCASWEEARYGVATVSEASSSTIDKNNRNNRNRRTTVTDLPFTPTTMSFPPMLTNTAQTTLYPTATSASLAQYAVQFTRG